MQIRSSSLPLLLIVGLLGWGLAATLGPRLAQAQSPTPVTSIVNDSSDTALEVTYSGGLLAPGKYAEPFNHSAPSDSIPAEGAGTRMMWYPEKAAFRAGRVGRFKDGTQWDAAKVGYFSTAFGVDTKASGYVATAMGSGTTASGNDATAMGDRTTASGGIATAMGFATTASGTESTAMGDRTTASGANATAMNLRTTASGRWTTAMGRNTTAATPRSVTLGECNSANTSADGTLLAVGNGSTPDRDCAAQSDALVLGFNGNLTISGTLTENSDRRLKSEIRALGSGILEKLSELRPVRFQFKNERTHPSGEQIGLIAQDVRKEFPSLVSEGSGDYLSLAYPKMTAVLLKGIQEQQAELQNKERRIAELEAENEAMKSRQREIEKRLAALETGRAPSTLAGLAGSGTGLLLAFLLGGLVGAGVLWRRRD